MPTCPKCKSKLSRWAGKLPARSGLYTQNGKSFRTYREAKQMYECKDCKHRYHTPWGKKRKRRS